MGDSKAIPGFGQVDIDLDEEPGVVGRRGGFGHVELDIPGGDEVVPPSTSRVFNTDPRPAKMRARAVSVHDESTRIVAGDALSEVTRPPPGLHEDGATRAWADIDSELASADEAPVSRSSNQSASGVASRDGRVAAMRELYAKGDAAGALALASTLGDAVVISDGGASIDHPDSSIVVEFGEMSIDMEDPFGGLLPLDEPDDEPAPLSKASATLTAPPPGAELTLTERQSIPRRLTSLGDLSKLKLDHRAGFLLAHIDGMQTLEEILDVCAMPAAEALSLFANLKALGVIEFE